MPNPNNPESQSNVDLENQYAQNLKKLEEEINQIKDVTDKEDDKIEWVFVENSEWWLMEKKLNQWLEDSLNKADVTKIQELLNNVKNVYTNPDLKLADDVRKDLMKLWNILTWILNKKNTEKVNDDLKWQQNKAFERFRWMIEGKNEKWKNQWTNTVNELNSLSGQEMKDILNYIRDDGNKSDVYNLYFSMGDVKFPSNYKSTDRKNYDDVLSAIENKYPELKNKLEETKKNFKLNEFFKDKSEAKNLGELAKSYLWIENWNWNNLEYPEGFNENNFEWKWFSWQDFVNKFNEINTERNNKNKDIVDTVVGNINISEDEMKKFKVEGWELKYDWVKFTQELMLNNFKDLINPELVKWDFINDGEKSDIVKQIYDKISEKINAKLWNSETPVSADAPKSAVDAKYEMIEEDFVAMKDKLWERMFIEKWENGEISYNLEKAKVYLNSIKNTEWSALKAKYWTPEWRAWISAIQILLNTQEWDKIKVDGKFGPETREKVRAFQEANSLKFKNGKEDQSGQPDGLPGKVTMSKLLENLWWVSSEVVGSDDGDTEAVTVSKELWTVEEIDDKILNSLNLQKKEWLDNDMLNSFNIAEWTTVYTRGWDSWYYYKSWNDIIRVSSDNPWIKKSINIPWEWGVINTDINSWIPKVDISTWWRSKLESIFKSEDLKEKIWEEDFNKLSILISETDPKQYQLKNSETTISLNDEMFLKDFCGVNKVEDKLNLVYLASDLKKNNKLNDLNEQEIVYWNDVKLPEGTNFADFINYCKTLE